MARSKIIIVGNGDSSELILRQPASYFKDSITLVCNIPPHPLDKIYLTGIVDRKFITAIHKGEIAMPPNVLFGVRPQKYLQEHPSFHMKIGARIKGFYTELPSYCDNHTTFNAGLFLTHYAANKLGDYSKEVHLYGMDSLFNDRLISFSDLVMENNRTPSNNAALIRKWRPVWKGLFNEFTGHLFRLFYYNDKIKIRLSENAVIQSC